MKERKERKEKEKKKKEKKERKKEGLFISFLEGAKVKRGFNYAL